MPLTLFRIVRNQVPSADDFRTMREEGRPLLDPRYEDEWANGISVLDDLNVAIRRARNNRTELGRYVATLLIPDDGTIRVRQTAGRHHFTIYASGQRVLDLVQGATIHALGKDPVDGSAL